MPTTSDLAPNDRVVDLVHDILKRRGVARTLEVDEDLREAGLNSLDMVNLMLAVEAEFDLKIPDSDMTLRNFRSIAAIDELIAAMLRDKGGDQRSFSASHAQG